MRDIGAISSYEKKLNRNRAWKQRNREKVNERQRAAYAADPEKYREFQRQNRKKHRDRVLKWNRNWLVGYRARLRAEMIAAFGGKCKCCGENEPKFLQLDHIFNDGAADRVVNKTSAKLWAALKRQGWPQDRHQLLCANCNFGKLMNGGTCPHQKTCQ